MTETAAPTLPGMPGPEVLHRVESQGQVVVRRGGQVLFVYDAGDVGMRNLAVVAVTGAGVPVKEAARGFGITATYVSMLRGRARDAGSAGLVKSVGRPPKLTLSQGEQARRWSGQGWAQQKIADRLGISQPQISVLLSRRGAIVPQPELPELAGDLDSDGPGVDVTPEPEPEPEPESAGRGRIGTGTVATRYAGATLGHAFLSRVGAAEVFAGLQVADGRAVFDDSALVCSVVLAFGLGVSSVEGAKLLRRVDAGPLSGLVRLPELRTLRPRLAAVADACDPLAVQRALASAMLTADAPALGVYYVDDHFVPYAGAKPLGRGWNNKRKQAQRGHGDTLVTDHRGRAVAFLTGEPSGLTKTLPKALTELRQITAPGAKLMLGFDRGGAYAEVFAHCRAQEVDWITYRRGTLPVTLVKPTRHAYPPLEAEAEAGRQWVELADELVEFKDYGTCRQLTLFEDGKARLQVLTSDLAADAASLLLWLRSRWRIENAIKDLAHLYGIDWLCDYRADLVDDDQIIDNPARKHANTLIKEREAELAAAERALARLVESPTRPVEQINNQIPAARRAVDKARAAITKAKQARDQVPTKIPANQLRPGQQRALPAAGRRTFQMVLRVLAYNTELWLADRLNTYLRDDNEYRALTRSLFHNGGTIDYQTHTIAVTLDPPDSPRLARALGLLIEEINHTPPTMPGDPRPITYKIKPQQ